MFGRWSARLHVADHIYPGCEGGTTTRNISLWTSAGKSSAPARLGDLPAVTLSEILRTVDLLVSTSGFAVATEVGDGQRETHLRQFAQSPLGAMAEMRKDALACALRGLDDLVDWQFDARHLRLGPYAIHLATSQVTCDGEPVTIDPPKPSNLTAVPWLPYDERLLETIFYKALDIAQRQKQV